MKSLYLAIIFLPIICGCKSKTSQSDITDKTRQKVSVNAQDTLRNFVSNIYKHNFMKTKAEVLDSLYLSSELYSLEKEYNKSYPDSYYNHWICDDFAYYPSFKIGKFTQLSDTTATVDIKVSNEESKSEYQLVMLLENGKWKVDDFVYNAYSDDASSNKSGLRDQLGLETHLRGSLSEYSLKFWENPEDEHEGAINLYKNKTIVSQNLVSVGGNKTFEGIDDTKEGFKIFYSWGHNKYFGNTIFLFKYQKGQFYLYKVIRYRSFEIEEGFDFKRTEEVLKTPIQFKDVDFEKFLF